MMNDIFKELIDKGVVIIYMDNIKADVVAAIFLKLLKDLSTLTRSLRLSLLASLSCSRATGPPGRPGAVIYVWCWRAQR